MNRTYTQWEVAAVMAAVRGEGDREKLLQEAIAPGEKSALLKKFWFRVRKYVAEGVLKCEVHPRYKVREFDADEIDAWAESYYKTAKQGVTLTRRKSKTAVEKIGGVKSLADARKQMNQQMRAKRQSRYKKERGADDVSQG